MARSGTLAARDGRPASPLRRYPLSHRSRRSRRRSTIGRRVSPPARIPRRARPGAALRPRRSGVPRVAAGAVRGDARPGARAGRAAGRARPPLRGPHARGRARADLGAAGRRQPAGPRAGGLPPARRAHRHAPAGRHPDLAAHLDVRHDALPRAPPAHARDAALDDVAGDLARAHPRRAGRRPHLPRQRAARRRRHAPAVARALPAARRRGELGDRTTIGGPRRRRCRCAC